MDLIGQQHILKALTSYNLLTIPKTVLLIGEEGSEQYLIAKKVAEFYNTDLIEITTDDLKLDSDALTEYKQCPVSKFYYIDLTSFFGHGNATTKLLKLLEEPGEHMYIIASIDSTAGIEEAILNRCLKFTCAPYTDEQLRECEWMVRNPNDLVYKVCRTPGQLADVDGDQVKALFVLCEKIINQIGKASYANALTLVSKINCDKNDEKFDFYQFFNALEYISFTKYIETKNLEIYKLYMYINKAKQSYLNKKVAKESFILNFLDGLWRVTH